MVAQVKPNLPTPKAPQYPEPKVAPVPPSHEEIRRQMGQFLIDPNKVYCPR